MIKVYLKKQSSHAIDSIKVKNELRDFFNKRGIKSNAVVYIAMVGKKRMLDISERYLNDNKMHNVLSFSEDEAKNDFRNPPDGKIYLGEIIVCYPIAINEAKKEEKRIDEKVIELVKHGALHLMGIHHE